MHWLLDSRTPVVFLMGPAGCGKTALAVAAAAKGLGSGLYQKVLLTRPNVEAGDRIGFLKGSSQEKNMPWVGPMLNEFKHWIGGTATDKFLKEEKISHEHI